MKAAFSAFLFIALFVFLPLAAHAGKDTPLKKWNDLVYKEVDGVQLKGDIIRPDDDKAYPGLLFVHGGGFMKGDKSQDTIVSMLESYARAGYVVFNINYRFVQDGGLFPENIMDVKCGLQWFSGHSVEYGLDPNRMATIGESAGGYFASMLATTAGNPAFLGECPGGELGSDRVDAAVSVYASHDFTKLADTHIKKSLHELLFDHVLFPEKVELWLSPITYVEDSVPMFLIVGDRDDLVDPNQSRAMRDALQRAGKECEFMEFPSEGHGWFTVKHLNKTQKAILYFFKKHLA